ncbi:MAG: methyltransferase domain-containing protein [Acidimicrobiia bacterium]
MTWDPSCYGAHADHRLRPGLELLARIPIEPTMIYDLGCGTGELTNYLGSRWPEATVVGIDNSQEMLDRARPQNNVTFVRQSIEDWKPPAAPDLIFSNAALHWVEDHDSLFPRLFGELKTGGALAVQMPDNWDAPTHLLTDQEIDRRGWTKRLDGHLPRRPVAAIDQYIAWLAGAKDVDAWRTTYFQPMSGTDPVLSWVRGTVLVPIRTALAEAEFQSLETSLAEQYRLAYPPLPNGITIMPMSRIFLLATK